MKILIDDIPSEGLHVSFSVPGSDAFSETFARAIAEAGVAEMIPRAQSDLELQRIGASVYVQGGLKATLESKCSRCLEPVNSDLDESFSYMILPVVPDESEPSEQETELNPHDMEVSFYDEDGIDLESVLAEQLLLSLPVQPLCDDECLGICQGCGAELNHEVCRCTVKEPDSRFAMLKTLRLPTCERP